MLTKIYILEAILLANQNRAIFLTTEILMLCLVLSKLASLLVHPYIMFMLLGLLSWYSFLQLS